MERIAENYTGMGTSIISLFEYHLKFWNTGSIGIPVRSLNAQQIGTTARLYSNKTPLSIVSNIIISTIQVQAENQKLWRYTKEVWIKKQQFWFE